MSRIRQWLADLELSRYGDVFEQNDLDFDVLSALSEADLEQIGVSLGHRKRILRAIVELADSPAHADESASTPDESVPLGPALSGERRQATVLFADLTGYTAMNEALDPEDVERVMSRIKADAVEIVEHHGGIVNQFVGDEVLALFGIPVAHDDDPVRAVRAALELHERVREISPEVEGQIGTPVRLHSGINTGLIVTHMGDDRDGRFGVTGDTINVGARLKSIAEADAILLSPVTQTLVADDFTSEPGNPIQLKGKTEDLVPHRVTGTIAVANRFVAGDRHEATPFTGRSRELGLLDSCLSKTLDSEGQVVTICADPGVGKSRLLFEFRSRIDPEQALVIHAGCPSSGQQRPYSPFVDLLSAILELNHIDGSAEVLEQIVNHVTSMDPGLERYLPHYLNLLSIPNDRYALPARFDGDEKRRAFEEALTGLITCASRSRPLVVLLEDWHWSDEASDSALAYLVSRISEIPVFIVVNYRPEYVAHWQDPGDPSIRLQSLDASDTQAMIMGILGVRVSPPGLDDLIGSRADGNPLFIEEICGSLLEDGTVRVAGGVATLGRALAEIVLPATVNSVIRGRLDRLEPVHQEALRFAAVIGRDFTTPILERVHSNPESLQESLAALAAQGLILPDDRSPGGYAFKHILVQTVIYETLLLKQRREIHVRVGGAMENVYADRLPNHVESLAVHFDLGEVWDKAAQYTLEAGVKALEHHAINVGLRYFERCRQVLTEHSPDVPWKLRYDLSFHRAAALGDRGQWLLACEELIAARALAETDGDVGSLVLAQVALANAAFWAQKFDESLEILQEVEARMGSIPDIQLRITPQQAFLNFMLERLPLTLAKEKEAAGLLRELPNSVNRSFAAFLLGVFLRWRGDHENASKLLETAVQYDKEHESAGVYLQSLMHYCLAIGEHGHYQAAIDLLTEGREYGLAADSLYGVLKITNTLGWAYLEICNFDASIHYNELALGMVDEAKNANTSTLSEVASFTRLNLVDIYLATDRLDEAQAQLDLISTTLEHENFALARTRWKPRYLLAQGESSLAVGKIDSARSWLAQVDASIFTQGFPFKKHQARAGRLRGAILQKEGQTDAAIESVAAALDQARLVGNPPQIWKLLMVLGDLTVNGDQAAQHYSEAAAIVDEVAEGLRDPEIERTFLEAASIRAVLAADGRS